MAQTRPRIAYLTSNDPRDRRSWSGTHYYIAKTLQMHCGDVTPIGPIKPASVTLKKAFRKGLRFLTGKTYLYTHTVALSKQLGEIAKKRIARDSFDLIFAPAGAGQIAYLETTIPIIYLSDTTFALIVNYYPEFSNLLKFCLREGEQVERLAIDKSRLAIFSSSWAAQSAQRDYHADPAKLHVVPFGANLDADPMAHLNASTGSSGQCRLIFLGVEWQRKGGDIAFDTLLELHKLGIPAHLTVVGCTPPKGISHPHLTIIPFLNKNDNAQRARLSHLLVSADFFILPTRADCTPIVLCEAQAFGLPVISTDTGGIPDIITHGKNGYLLPLSARGDEYARIIAASITNTEEYVKLRLASRES